MSVALRYLRSDLRYSVVDANAQAAGSVGVDVTGYYQSEEEAYDNFNGRTRFGFAIQNLGPTIKYDDGGTENFIPTTLRLGGGFDFIFDEYNKLSVTAEVAKLLVPTPPILGDEFVDSNNDGDLDEDELATGSIRENVIFSGQVIGCRFPSRSLSIFWRCSRRI